MSELITCTEVVALRLGRIVRKFWPDVTATCLGGLVLFWIKPDRQTRRHEFEHVAQAYKLTPTWVRRLPWWMGLLNLWWVFAYWREWRRVGYWDSVYEKDARRAAGQD